MRCSRAVVASFHRVRLREVALSFVFATACEKAVGHDFTGFASREEPLFIVQPNVI